MSIGNTVADVIRAERHLGQAQPVGVIAHEKHISMSGFDIGYGNRAARPDIPVDAIVDRVRVFIRKTDFWRTRAEQFP